MEYVIMKTVAAFLNTEGGTLLIGVDDNGKITGLKADYKTLGKKQDKDVFENWLTGLLLDNIGKEFSLYLRIHFHLLENQEIARILVTPAPKPVYVKEENQETFYIRTGNSTRALNTREAIEYIRTKWGI